LIQAFTKTNHRDQVDVDRFNDFIMNPFYLTKISNMNSFDQILDLLIMKKSHKKFIFLFGIK